MPPRARPTHEPNPARVTRRLPRSLAGLRPDRGAATEHHPDRAIDCRAGTVPEFHGGTARNCGQASFVFSDHSNAAYPSPESDEPLVVGAYPCNAFGLHDTHGNVQASAPRKATPPDAHRSCRAPCCRPSGCSARCSLCPLWFLSASAAATEKNHREHRGHRDQKPEAQQQAAPRRRGAAGCTPTRRIGARRAAWPCVAQTPRRRLRRACPNGPRITLAAGGPRA